MAAVWRGVVVDTADGQEGVVTDVDAAAVATISVGALRASHRETSTRACRT